MLYVIAPQGFPNQVFFRVVPNETTPIPYRAANARQLEPLVAEFQFADGTLYCWAGMRPPRQWAGLRVRRLGCISASVVLTLGLVLTFLSSASSTVLFVVFDVAVVDMTAARIRLHKWP